MIQLSVLTGGAAGQQFQATTFPVTVGRDAARSLVLNDPGVFQEHFEIQLTAEGFLLRVSPNAVTAVNGAPVERVLLRNGDVIAAGLAKMQFSLAPMKQKALALRETATWLLVAAAVAAQIYFAMHLVTLAR